MAGSWNGKWMKRAGMEVLGGRVNAKNPEKYIGPQINTDTHG